MGNWPKYQVQPKNHVDTTKPTEVTHISLCTGYGGIDLGLRRCVPSLRTIAYAEIEASAIELLLARMEGGALDAAPVWTNLRTFPWGAFSGKVDILSGGYPCQPFSAAGKRLGADDERHLWPAIADGIRILRPRVCFFENVEGHITLGLSTVISDLEELGYEATWGVFSASEVGSVHQRKRVFIMAVASGIGGETGVPGQVAWNERLAGIAHHCSAQDMWPSRPGEPQHWWEPPRVVANTGHDAGERRSAVGEVPSGDDGAQGACEAGSARGEDEAGEWEESEPLRSSAEPAVGDTSSEGCEGGGGQDDSRRQAQRLAESDGGCSDRGMEQEQREVEQPLGRGVDGPSDWLDYAELCVSSDNRTDELRMLGNGVVPATAAKAFETLMRELL